MLTRTLTKKLAQVKPNTLFVGVDLGLERHVAVLMTERAAVLSRFGFANDRAGYDYFYQRIAVEQAKHGQEAVLIGLEPTNFFWQLLAADIEQQHPEYGYRLVNPYTVKKHREGDQLERSKDDNRDAFTVADLLRTGKFTETRLLHGRYAELRQLVNLYYRLQRDVRRHKNLIWNLSGQLFPELTQVFAKLTGATALALLQQHAAAACIRQLALADFVAGVRADYAGKRLHIKKLRQAHALAQHSVGLREGIAARQLALRIHVFNYQTCCQQLDLATRALTDSFLQLPEAVYLLSVNQLGVTSAATILSEIGDPRHYTSSRQLVKLAGTQPVVNTSGQKTRSLSRMSHQGRARLRTTLFFAVMRLVSRDAAFAQLYQQLQTRPTNPLTKMQALGVLMNKLLRVLWALMRQRTYYSAALVAGR